MKQTIAFAGFHSNRLRKSYRWMSMIFMLIFMLGISVGTVKSQSKDQDNPTTITSNVVSGTLSPDENGTPNTYYYSFVAGPGDVAITLTVEATDDVVQARFALLDENEVVLGGKTATAPRGYNSQAVATINLKRRQRVVLAITQSNIGSGKYRVRIGGAVELGQNKSGGITSETPTSTLDPKYNSECLPKRGTLIIRMKDGSKKIIDLSDAETITVVP